jgi:hypothetical protein
MKKLLLLVLVLCSVQYSRGQTYTIKGTVKDTLNNSVLHRASIVLVRTKDSVIETYTRTSEDGKFEIQAPAKGKYLLRISFPSFVDYLEVLDLKKPVTDLGTMPMVSKEHLLKEFVLTKQIAAIKIKGDTTEYMADSFKVKEGATVEDLLKKLPGIQVDKDGNITAQGETVQKVLVDGEEFFSDDPKVVTQGLQAGAIEKVQVYNKKSDQAEFTGIDDGQKTKTINLELKEDKKKGYFGKTDVGGETDNYFQEQGMINAFKGKRQFSAFGIASNTDKIGLGWEDKEKFGSGSNTVITDAGNIVSFSSSSDQDMGGWDGKYSGQGLPETYTAGGHFADKWNNDKDHLVTNYRYSKQNVEMNGTTTTQQVLPDNAGFTTHQDKVQSNAAQRHGLDLMYERNLDSNNTVKFTVDGGYRESQSHTLYATNTLNQDSSLINNNDRRIVSNSYSNYLNADVLYKRKFKKKGRTLSVDVKENYKDSRSDGILKSNTEFADTANHPQTVNQEKISNSNMLAFSGKATYTEPLSKVAFVEINYGATLNNSEDSNYSYNLDSYGNRMAPLDSLHSSKYKFNILTNTGGLNFKFNYKTVNFSFGSDVANTGYQQTDVFRGGITTNRSYFNLFPMANFTYKISKQTSLQFYYYGSTQQPTIAQIQPLNQNIDPLNITMGNPGLKQQFTSRYSLRFNDYKVLTNRYIYGSFSFSNIYDAITTSQKIDNGVTTTTYINLNGNYSGSGYFGGGFKPKNWDTRLGMWVNTSVNHANNRVNGQPNSNDYNTYSIGPRIDYDKKDKYELSADPNVTYNDNRSTISTFTSSYWSFNMDISGSIQLPKKFEIGTTCNFMFREKTEIFTTNNNVIKWNAYVGKKFLKNGQLEVKASVYDILDQNIGYSRNATAGVVTENTYNTIRRYGMLQLIWNFTHTPAGAPQPAGNMIIMH